MREVSALGLEVSHLEDDASDGEEAEVEADEEDKVVGELSPGEVVFEGEEPAAHLVGDEVGFVGFEDGEHFQNPVEKENAERHDGSGGRFHLHAGEEKANCRDGAHADPDEQGRYDQSEHGRSPIGVDCNCLLYTSPSPRDQRGSRMPSSA